MAVYVRDGGSWKRVNHLWVRDAGSWKRVSAAYVRDAGTWKQFFARPHATTVTVGSALVDFLAVHDMQFTIMNTFTFYGFGYDGGADYFNATGFGSIGNPTFTDYAGNTRTITSTYWTGHGILLFTLSGASVPNSDNTFSSISIEGHVYNRANATYESGTPAGATTWWWESPTVNPFGQSGTKTFEVHFK